MTGLEVQSAESMQALGKRIGHRCRPGDLIVLAGDLGSGKTTLVQGLGRALGVTEQITSPTFVIARVHVTDIGLPQLVHVDAYRLGSVLEFDDLGLDADFAESVMVVEWGEGKAEQLSSDYLTVQIVRADDGSDETRRVDIRAVGDRWTARDLELIVGP